MNKLYMLLFCAICCAQIGNLLGSGYMKEISCESFSTGADDLPLTGPMRIIVEVRINKAEKKCAVPRCP